jgi:hypothetical protein
MGRWVQVSKRPFDVADVNELVNVHELGAKEGNQIVQGQHFFTTETSGEAQSLAVFLRTESAVKLSEADKLFLENIQTRLNDGYLYVRYFNFRVKGFVYVGKWDPASEQFEVPDSEAVYMNHKKRIVARVGDIVMGPGQVRSRVTAVTGAMVAILKISDDGTDSVPRWEHHCPADQCLYLEKQTLAL